MRDGISTPTTDSVDSPSEGAAAGADPFKATVAQRFGVLPNFFCTAEAAAGLIEELWAFAKSAYLDSPLPSLFKERLFVHLSRFCEVRYCIVRYVGFLVGEGRPAGDASAAAESVQQALTLLVRPVPDAVALEQIYTRLRSGRPMDLMPSPETQAEADLFDALTVIFLVPNRSAQARLAVRHAVGDRAFELLTAFLAFVRTAHYWTETHPELAYEPDVLALMEAHPELGAALLDRTEAEAAAGDSALRQALHASETALRESEARHRLLIESWAQAVWETDAEGVVVKDSPSWRAYTGQTLDERLGYGWLNAIHPEDRAYAERQWREAVAAKSLVDAEFRLRSPDGTYHWTNVRAAPVLDGAGAIKKWAGMNIDIDARKRAEMALRESEERFRVLADNMAQLAWTCDALGNVTWYNKRWLDYTGMTFEDMKGWDWSKVQHPDHVDRVVEKVKRSAETGEPWDDTFPLRGRDGSYRWFLSRASPVRNADGDIISWFGTNTDVTETLLAERNLRESEERQTFLLELSDALRPLGDPIEIMATASALTGPHLGLDRCFYGEVDPALEHVYLADSYCADGTPPFPQRVQLDDFGEEFLAIIVTGATLAVDDIRIEPQLADPAQRGRLLAAQVGACVGVRWSKGDGWSRSCLPINRAPESGHTMI